MKTIVFMIHRSYYVRWFDLIFPSVFGTDRDQEDGDEGMTRREAVALLSSVASALAGLAIPSAVRILGMTGVEAADPLIISALHGVSFLFFFLNFETGF